MLINNTPLKECYRLGKYAAEHGLNHFKSKNFKEGTADTFESKYHVINDPAIKKHSPKKVLNIKKGWRSHIVEEVRYKNSKISDSNYKLWDCNQYQYCYSICKWFLKHSKDESMNRVISMIL